MSLAGRRRSSGAASGGDGAGAARGSVHGGIAEAVAFGTTVVASLLLFTAFVALFRRDLGDPAVAAGTFAAAAGAVWLSGRLVRRLGRTSNNAAIADQAGSAEC